VLLNQFYCLWTLLLIVTYVLTAFIDNFNWYLASEASTFVVVLQYRCVFVLILLHIVY